MQERRETEYDYPRWLQEGWYLHDWDEKTNEYILRPQSTMKRLTHKEARECT